MGGTGPRETDPGAFGERDASRAHANYARMPTAVRGKLIQWRAWATDPAAYANYGAGRSPQLTQVARRGEDLEASRGSTLVAPHIAVEGVPIAGALPRLTIEASGGDPCPDRELRGRFRANVEDGCGNMWLNGLVVAKWTWV